MEIGEIRCPTQSEWLHAKNSAIIDCKAGSKEILADAVSSNYRGAMMDGRPRLFQDRGPMQWHTATMEIHPNNSSIHALSSAPMDRNSSGLSLRLVVTPIRKGAARIVPKRADYGANIRSRAIVDNYTWSNSFIRNTMVKGHGRLRLLRLGKSTIWRIMRRICNRCILATEATYYHVSRW